MIRAIVLMSLGLLSDNIMAHEMRPAISTLTVDSNGILALEWEINLEAWLVGIDPLLQDTDESSLSQFYDAKRNLSADDLVDQSRARWRELAASIEIKAKEQLVELAITQIEINDPDDFESPRIAKVKLIGGLPDQASSFTYSVSQSHPNTAIRFMQDYKMQEVQFVESGQVSAPFFLGESIDRSLTRVISQYVQLGFLHIIPRGLDHILFILGLALISKKALDLLLQVTAFTVSHSVTLALSLNGLVVIPASIVEPLIAISILYISVENIWRQSVHRSRIGIVFCFGLLHGFGFAGVLMELGLPARDFIIGLLSFNLGVELGQLAIIMIAYITVGSWTLNSSWYRSVIVLPSSAVIGLFGLYWLIERLL